MNARLVGWVAETGRVDAPMGALARVGAAPDNDLVLRVEGVSRAHARIVREADGYWLEDVRSRNGTWLNGERISRVRLHHLDVITLGRLVELVFVERPADRSAAAPAAASGFQARIEWLDGPDRGAVIDLPRGETIIGRARSCGIAIDSPAVSRAHARLTHTADRVTIEDLGTVNGTSVDGRPISGAVPLETRAEIDVGQVRRFRVLIDGRAAEAAERSPAEPTTPSGVKDMEWATRLVLSAEDLEALQIAPPDKPAAETPNTPPAEPRVLKEVGPAEAAWPPDRVEPTMMAAPPTELGAPALGVPPPALQPETNVGERTNLDAPGPAKVPAALQRGTPEPTNLPAQTVLGFREVGPAPFPKPPTNIDATVIKPTAAPSSADRRALVAVRLAGDLGVFTLPSGSSTVGRSSEATLRIDSREVSRIHARVVVSDNEVTVEDCGSANGTSVNGSPIAGVRALIDGDRVWFADFEFRVELVRTEGGR